MKIYSKVMPKNGRYRNFVGIIKRIEEKKKVAFVYFEILDKKFEQVFHLNDLETI